MTNPHTSPIVIEKTPSEVVNIAVSFADKLGPTELLIGTPVLSAAPSGLTVGSGSVNVAAMTIDQRTVAIGQAVLFVASSGTVDIDYLATITCGTNATPAQTLQRFVQVKVIGA